MFDSVKEKKLTLYISNYLTKRDSIFFNQKNVWITSKNVKWIFPDSEIFRFEKSDDNKTLNFYSPTLLSILEVGKDTFETKIAFMHGFSSGEVKIKGIYNFILKTVDTNIFLIPQTDYYTKDWDEKKIGNVRFHFKKNHKFNDILAAKMDGFNLTTALFFKNSSIDFDYYLTNGLNEIFRIKGFDYTPGMFYSNQKYARSDLYNSKIFGGNGTEYYPHEIVHLYTHAKFGNNINTFFDEGIATYLGGSQDSSLEWHSKQLKLYLANHPKENLNDIFENNFIIADKTNVLYVIGGLLCKIVFEKQGKDALFKMMENSYSDEVCYKNIFTFLGVTKDNLHQFIINELSK